MSNKDTTISYASSPLAVALTPRSCHWVQYLLCWVSTEPGFALSNVVRGKEQEPTVRLSICHFRLVARARDIMQPFPLPSLLK